MAGDDDGGISAAYEKLFGFAPLVFGFGFAAAFFFCTPFLGAMTHWNIAIWNFSPLTSLSQNGYGFEYAFVSAQTVGCCSSRDEVAGLMYKLFVWQG